MTFVMPFSINVNHFSPTFTNHEKKTSIQKLQIVFYYDLLTNH